MLELLMFGLGCVVGYMLNRSFNYREYLRSAKWKKLRNQVLERDNHQCQYPNCKNKYGLQVHHKTYDRIGHENLSDLITLCSKHHKTVETKVKNARQIGV